MKFKDDLSTESSVDRPSIQESENEINAFESTLLGKSTPRSSSTLRSLEVGTSEKQETASVLPAIVVSTPYTKVSTKNPVQEDGVTVVFGTTLKTPNRVDEVQDKSQTTQSSIFQEDALSDRDEDPTKTTLNPKSSSTDKLNERTTESSTVTSFEKPIKEQITETITPKIESETSDKIIETSEDGDKKESTTFRVDSKVTEAALVDKVDETFGIAKDEILDEKPKPTLSDKLTNDGDEEVSIANIISKTVDAYIEESQEPNPDDLVVKIETKPNIETPEIQIEPESDKTIKATVKLPGETEQSVEFQVPIPAPNSMSPIDVEDLAETITNNFDQKKKEDETTMNINLKGDDVIDETDQLPSSTSSEKLMKTKESTTIKSVSDLLEQVSDLNLINDDKIIELSTIADVSVSTPSSSKITTEYSTTEISTNLDGSTKRVNDKVALEPSVISDSAVIGKDSTTRVLDEEPLSSAVPSIGTTEATDKTSPGLTISVTFTTETDSDENISKDQNMESTTELVDETTSLLSSAGLDKDKSVNVSTISMDTFSTQATKSITTSTEQTRDSTTPSIEGLIRGSPTTSRTVTSKIDTTEATTESSFFGSDVLERVRDLSLALIAGLIANSVGFPFSPVNRKTDKEGVLVNIPTKPPVVIAKDPFVRNKVQGGEGAFDGNVFNLTIPIRPEDIQDLKNDEVRRNISNVVKEAFGSVDPSNDDITVIIDDPTQDEGKIFINAPYIPSQGTSILPKFTTPATTTADSRPKLPRLDDERPRPNIRPPFSLFPSTRPPVPQEPTEPERSTRPSIIPTVEPRTVEPPIQSIPPFKRPIPVPTLRSTTKRPIFFTTSKPKASTIDTDRFRFEIEDAVTRPTGIRSTQRPIFEEFPTLKEEPIFDEEPLFEYGQVDDNRIPNIPPTIFSPQIPPIQEDPREIDYILDSVVVDENQVYDRRLNFLSGSSANIVEATVVEDLSYARSVRESSSSTIGIATISSITVGVIALLAFALLIFLALARRRRRKYDTATASSANMTPTQSRTTFSGTPVMADTPSVSGGFADDPLNTTSSSTIDPVLAIDGHQTIISSYNEFMSIPNDARNNIMRSLPSPLSSSEGGHPPSSSAMGPTSEIPRTRDLIESSPFLFAPHHSGNLHYP